MLWNRLVTGGCKRSSKNWKSLEMVGSNLRNHFPWSHMSEETMACCDLMLYKISPCLRIFLTIYGKKPQPGNIYAHIHLEVLLRIMLCPWSLAETNSMKTLIVIGRDASAQKIPNHDRTKKQNNI